MEPVKPPPNMTRTPPPLALVKKGVERIEQAEQFRNQYIREAFDPELRRQYGYTVDDIATAAGLSRPRIYQIIKE